MDVRDTLIVSFSLLDCQLMSSIMRDDVVNMEGVMQVVEVAEGC